MANITQVNFSFAFASLPQLETHVVRFSGTAALNSLYDLAITLLLPTEAFEKTDIETLMSSRCSLTIDDSQDRLIEHWPSAWKTSWHGLLTKLEVGSQAGQYTFLEVCLGPTIGLLSGQLQNRIHLDLSSLDVLKDSFRFGGLSADQFSIKAQKDAYPKREFVFQYEEDLLDFVWRTLWREGLCLFYDQNGQSDLALVTDAPEQHPCCYDGSSEIGFSYSSLTGLKGDGPQIFSMRSENRLPPNSILLKDYNWEDPNRPLAVKVRVSPKGRGEVHLYGQNFTTLAEGQRLGNIRRDEYLSNSETFRAVTRAPGLMPGLTFAINSHPIASNNDRFLVTSSEIIGSQADRLTAVLGLDLGTEKSDFTNNLKFRRLDKPFRPSLTLPRSKISGSLTAWIDGSGGGATPELDQWGRYKVLFPLDVSGRSQGKASAWLRMAQPYVGKGYGQNFPLTPGAEVLITFIDGNPDRPVISGAVPNAENISLINSATNTYSGLGTKGGSALLFGDEAGKQKISLTSGSNRAGLTIN
ncbi:MAG: type VI secretion system tip protein VgrG, partial [Deltaproteobacteria bacterium]|nr:type VI secretion system tip protein VgrG [Deltaproteobacteria bacterium]